MKQSTDNQSQLRSPIPAESVREILAKMGRNEILAKIEQARRDEYTHYLFLQK